MEWMFMPLKRYADFSGRSRRMEFWMWQLFQIVVYFVVVVLMMVVGGGAMMMGGMTKDPSSMLAAGGVVMIVMLLYLVYCLAVIIPSIAVAVRRPARHQPHRLVGARAARALCGDDRRRA